MTDESTDPITETEADSDAGTDTPDVDEPDDTVLVTIGTVTSA